MNCVEQNVVIEWSFSSKKKCADSFNEIDLDVIFTTQNGEEKLVPAFWAGGNIWRVRFSSPTVGRFHYRTICTDPSNSNLHDQKGEFEVVPYRGTNSLLQHGPLQVSSDKRHFEHFDGTPFFWLADTWWMSLCQRLGWPKEFQTLALDRVEKGFCVIQIVAGLYPDMSPFDERGTNEAGFPWEKDYIRINPNYFNLADRRINYLVEVGLIPCIVGCWGYYLSFMGVEKIKKHWRYLVARYGAYSVVWCLAGEATMPYYLSKDFLDYFRTGQSPTIEKQKKGWTEVARYLHQIDPFNNLITIHPSVPSTTPPELGRDQIEDPSLIDFDMLQTGHFSHLSLPNTIKSLKFSLDQKPKMPVLVGEVCYEGTLEASREEIQRLLFWTCVLSGAAGHSYGANGIWQINRKEKPFGPSPYGVSWGEISWDEASQLPGSKQLGIAKKFLERYPWWQFEPHPEWIEIDKKLEFYAEDKDYFIPYAGGIPRKVRLFYFHPLLAGFSFFDGLPLIKHLEPEVKYQAILFNPSNGTKYELGSVIPNKEGDWQLPTLPIFRDWVLALEAE